MDIIRKYKETVRPQPAMSNKPAVLARQQEEERGRKGAMGRNGQRRATGEKGGRGIKGVMGRMGEKGKMGERVVKGLKGIMRDRRVPLLIGIVLIAIAIGTLLVIRSDNESQAAWYNSSWDYRKQVTIDKDKVTSGTRVQSGTSTILANTTSITATIDAIDKSKSFLNFSFGHNAPAPQDSAVGGRITDSTTLTFERGNAVSSPAITIYWQVVTFDSGVYVQHGTTLLSATTNNVTISSVDTSKAFIIISKRATTGTTYDGNDFLMARLTTSTNLEISFTTGSGGYGEWQVIEYQNSSVQSGVTSFGTGDGSKTATITAVDTSKSWLVVTYRSNNGTATNIGQKMIRGVITNNTTLTFDRDSTGQTADVSWFVVSFTDETTVQSGSASFGTGDTVQNATINSIDTSRAIAMTAGYSNNGGKTNYTSDDNPGASMFAMEFTSSTNLRMTRAVTLSSTAAVGWFVVEFEKNQQNFPLLFSRTDNDLKYTGWGGGVGKTDGTDILFTSSDGTTKLSHEIETYASSTGALVSWVKVPVLHTAKDTVLYMYYGNSGAADQTDAANVWDSNYKGVYHLANINDSTSNARNLSNAPNPGTAANTSKIGGAYTFNGSDQAFSSSAYDSDNSANITISGWVIPSSSWTTTNDKFLFGIDESGSGAGANINYGLDTTGTINFNYYRAAVGDTNLSYTTTLNSGVPYYLSATFDDTGDIQKFYLNGIMVGSRADTQSIQYYTDSLWIARTALSTYYANATIDEVRVSNIARSADWIKTEYANQGHPRTFYSVGGQEVEQVRELPGQAVTTWYNTAWGFRKQLATDPSKVTGTTGLTNFPMLVSFTDPDIKFTSSGGRTASSTAGDILFVDWEGNKLDHEIEKYTSTTGELVAWVKMPFMSSTTTRSIYMYYGNASASYQPTNETVWDSNYKGVWHLNQDPSGSAPQILDSTSNSNDLTSNGTMTSDDLVAGKIGYGQDLDGSNDYFSRAAGTYTTVGDDFTFSVWLKGNSVYDKGIIAYGGTALSAGQWAVTIENTTIHLRIWPDGGSNTAVDGSVGFDVTDGNDRFVTVARNSTTGQVVYYVDGVQVDSQTGPTGQADNYQGTRELRLGGTTNYASMVGVMDEGNVSNSIRSADWIKTEYTNQNSPSSFYSVGGEQGAAQWYSSSWTKRRQITIDHNKVSGSSDLTDFPALISLASDSHIASYASSTGADILFTLADGKTKLSHEIETYASTTGQLVSWVKVPILHYDQDTVLYMYYGNTAASDQQDAAGVWSSNYKGVWHLQDADNGNGSTYQDATSNNNDGTLVDSDGDSSQIAGKIGNSFEFNGDADYINMGDPVSGSLDIGAGSVTVSAWARPGANVNGFILNKRASSAAGYEILYGSGSVAGRLTFRYTGAQNSDDSDGWNDGRWHYIVGVLDSSSSLVRIYVDGLEKGTANSVTPSDSSNATNFQLGARVGANVYAGGLDEARVSNSVHTADWIATEYANQSRPQAFFGISTIQHEKSNTVKITQATTGTWPKRAPVTITNSNASELTDHQVKVSVTYDSDMQSDFDDIRFKYSDEVTDIDYWLETKTDGVSATFWVEVPTLAASGDTIIYMYYGNPDATSASSLENTFVNDSIYLEARRCTDATNCGFTDSHAEFESIISAGYTLDGSGYRTAVNDSTNPYSGTQDYYFMRYRFLLKIDTTGTWYFGANNDDAGEVNQRAAGDTTSATVLAYWYGGHASGTCGTSGTPGSASFSSGDVIWLEYRMTEWTGGALAQACAQKPGGSYQTINTTNFPGQIFTRKIVADGTDPSASVGSEQSASGGVWESSSWNYRKKIVIDHNKVSGSSALTNFPVLISSTHPDLRFTGSGGGVASSTAGDIKFTASDGTTKLDHEIEKYTSTTGELVAWVEIPSLSPTKDTVIYMYYGNAGASYQPTNEAVWDSNYKGVWHLPNGSALSGTDSTSNANTGTATGATAGSGKIDGGASFDGTNDNINAGSAASLDDIVLKTVSFWMNSSAAADNFDIPVSKNAGSAGWHVGHQRFSGPADRIEFYHTWSTGGGKGEWFTPNGSLPTGVWKYVVVTYDRTLTTNDPTIYIDGVSQSLTENVTPAGSAVSDAGANLKMGENDGGGGDYQGLLDEVRVSSVIRSADWITTEYTNQASPSTFYAMEGQQTETMEDSSGNAAPKLKVRGGVRFRFDLWLREYLWERREE